MPATSLKQFHLMKGIASGSIAPKGTLTKSVASEFVGHQSPKGLPTTAPKRHKVRFPKPSKPK